MDDDLLWEVILSYVGNGSKAAPTSKMLGAAARSRAARPYFLTALKRGAAPLVIPARLESAARRIGGFLLRRARRRLGTEDEEKAPRERVPDIFATIKELVRTIKPPAPPHIAVVFASGGWGARLDDIRAALRKILPASTVLLGGAAPGVLGATRSKVDEVEPGDEHGAISLALIRLDGGAHLTTLYVPPFGDPHAPAQDVIGRLPAPGDGPEHAPRLMLVLAEDQRAAHAALQKVAANRELWRAAGFPPCAVSGGLLGSSAVEMGGALLIDDAQGLRTNSSRLSSAEDHFPGRVVDLVRPDLSDDSGAGCVVLAVAGQTRASSAVSRGASVVGPHVYAASNVSEWKVGVCPGHAVTMGKADGLLVKAARGAPGAPYQSVEPSPISPGASLRAVQQFLPGGRMPRPLYFGVRPYREEEQAPVDGYNLLTPQHLDDDGTLALDGDVNQDAWCAWLTLEPDASVAELEAAAEASRIQLRLESKSRGARALPLRSGLDDTLSVLGGLVFTCSGRGARFHSGLPNRDSLALRAGRRGLPLCGAFCNGEIGPPPFREQGGGAVAEGEAHVAGFTCSAVVLRLDGAEALTAP